ncbi:MFS transporter [Brevibacillus sp. 7WMA2]|uniref:MFS transporter n=1 Tax=Brevibacillus sp. 7WMA2 TaxID=2683193 RepID=UPI0013A7A030|nr:MFS transporter [Brevibacillus sp. 7WMA2]QIC08005.1 MFS transporter [Brevibacillus sp. 7WMA2]
MQLKPINRKRARIITVLATFFAFMGIGVVDPILPVIAEQIHATHWQVEMLFTAYIFTMAIMMLPSGILAVRLGDKKLMMIGLAIVTVFSLLCAMSSSIVGLSWFRAGWGLGNSMFFATAMTLLIALSDEVSGAVGMYEAAIGLGMAGGPLVGGLLGGFAWNYPFFATSFFIFCALLLVIFFVHEPSKKQERQTAGLKELLSLLTYKPFMQGALSGMLYYYCFFVILAYSPLVLHLTAIQLGFVFFGWGLMLAYGSAVLSHKLEARLPYKMLIRYGLLALVVILLGLFAIPSSTAKIILIIVSGLVLGLNNALYSSYVMEISPYERAITSGVYNFVRWLGAALAPLLSGVIGHTLAPQAPFAVAVILSLAAIIIMSINMASKERTV